MNRVASSDLPGSSFSTRAVANLRSKFARDVLNQAATKEDVERLRPVTDRQNRPVRGKGVLDQSEVSSFAGRVGIDRGRVALRVEVCRVYVGGAAGQKECVQFRSLALPFPGGRGERNQHGLTAD